MLGLYENLLACVHFWTGSLYTFWKVDWKLFKYTNTQIHKYTNTNTQIHKETKTQQKTKDDLQNWILIAQMNCVAREANKIAKKNQTATCEFP